MIPQIIQSQTPLFPSFGHKVRLLDGSTLSTVFKAQEPLAAVRVYIQMNGETDRISTSSPHIPDVCTQI